MLTAVKGVYENGQIILHEPPIVQNGTEVVVTFLEDETINKEAQKRGGVRFGSLAGKVSLPTDFNDPLDELRDYM